VKTALKPPAAQSIKKPTSYKPTLLYN